MSYPVANETCDGTKGPIGCRCCIQAAVQCVGYLITNARIPNPQHGGENPPLPSTGSSPDEIPNPSTIPPDSPNRTRASRSVRDGSAGTTTRGFGYLHWSANICVPQLPTNGQSDSPSIHYERTPSCPPEFIQASIVRVPTPVNSSQTGLYSSVRAYQFLYDSALYWSLDGRSVLSLSSPLLIQSHSISTNLTLDAGEKGRTTRAGQSLQSRPSLEWTTSQLGDEPEVRDPENLEVRLMNELVLDRRIESNTLPFLVHGFASWSTLFISETTQIIPVVADQFRHSRSFDPQTRQTMLLISNTSLAISRTTDYNLPQYTTLQKQLISRLWQRWNIVTSLSRCCSKLGRASVLSVMDLYASVFRRACPECSEGLVDLRRCLTILDVQLKYYASLDVLLIITHRPMFLRYTLDFLPPQEEHIVKPNKGTGPRWMHVSDQLMFTLAKMNGLFEDFWNGVDPETIQELEQEIAACRPVVSIGSGEDPILNLGRIMFQEAWMMATRVYLYMGLCGANSLDAREVKV
ncbi:unnamed protein product [Rhizoctonia solani]|uniref:Transcription factor domain-containing protein n=1 Tax=Rhizoctonia solani TaxID=456999 RepID=A0A8H3BZV0_9AGAM|nr:unnamed protein product [Rhizoctonia solani]